MATTRVFKSGNSQAVRLPVGFQFTTNEVEIFKRNNEIIIREKPRDLSRAFELLTHLPEDFFTNGREDSLPQEREF
ncbi:MAG: AbrB/MazE/SpoVT family DNA-binding domain-containing protein [Legionellales bacterium]|nr:AbrB/MazE/SpoVT family DNA-binding domain-containing protein [Legionellales bacterium]